MDLKENLEAGRTGRKQLPQAVLGRMTAQTQPQAEEGEMLRK